MEKKESVDFKEMYLKMARAAEKAMNILIEAQRACEEMYIKAGEEGAEATRDGTA